MVWRLHILSILQPACGFLRSWFFWPSPILRKATGEAVFWGISCAISWTYAFLSSLSADQPLGYCGFHPAGRIRTGDWASLTAPEYGYKEFDAPPVHSLIEPNAR